jgi:hypothetical protein
MHRPPYHSFCKSRCAEERKKKKKKKRETPTATGLDVRQTAPGANDKKDSEKKKVLSQISHMQRP